MENRNKKNIFFDIFSLNFKVKNCNLKKKKA